MNTNQNNNNASVSPLVGDLGGFIIGIGETIVDIIFKNNQPISAKPGGSTFNTLISLGRLNVPCFFISEIGNDRLGENAKQCLHENNIPTDYMYQFSDGKSPVALAFLDENNNADYVFYKDYPKQRLNIEFPSVSPNDILIFGSYFSVNPVLRNRILELLHSAKNNDAIIYYDPNYRKSHLPELPDLKDSIEENFAFADIIRGSDEDFLNIYGENDIDTIYAKISRFCTNFICTKAEKRVFLYTKNFTKTYSTPTIKTISTVGAGDSFNAGILYGLKKLNISKQELPDLPEEKWDKLIEYAILFATDVCQSYENYISEKLVNELK